MPGPAGGRIYSGQFSGRGSNDGKVQTYTNNTGVISSPIKPIVITGNTPQTRAVNDPITVFNRPHSAVNINKENGSFQGKSLYDQNNAQNANTRYEETEVRSIDGSIYKYKRTEEMKFTNAIPNMNMSNGLSNNIPSSTSIQNIEDSRGGSQTSPIIISKVPRDTPILVQQYGSGNYSFGPFAQGNTTRNPIQESQSPQGQSHQMQASNGLTTSYPKQPQQISLDDTENSPFGARQEPKRDSQMNTAISPQFKTTLNEPIHKPSIADGIDTGHSRHHHRHAVDDQMSHSSHSQLGHQAMHGDQTRDMINPRYVGEIEAALGRFRVENSSQKDLISELEGKVKSSNASISALRQEIENVSHELTQMSQLRAKVRELELDRESHDADFKTSRDQIMHLREQVFNAAFDKFAYESNLRDNQNLREHQKQMAEVMTNMKEQFDEYIRLAGSNPDEIRRRESLVQNLDAV